MRAVGIVFLVLFLLALAAAVYIVYIRWRANQAGLPPPPLSSYWPFGHDAAPSSTYPVAPRPSGPLAWIQDKFASLRTAGSGAGYTGTRARRGGAGGGFGALDPDGAWDDRVGSEADAYHGRMGAGYEEQELGLHPAAGGADHYGGGGYGEPGAETLPAYGEERGRRRSRDAASFVGGDQSGLDQRYEEDMSGDPFADGPGLRGVSPRPVEMGGEAETSGQGMGHAKKGSGDSVASPTERKSMFREAM